MSNAQVKGGKYSHFLKNLKLQRWLRSLEKGSPITAEVALRRLDKACELLETNPSEIVDRAKENLDSFQDSLEDLVAKLESEGKAP